MKKFVLIIMLGVLSTILNAQPHYIKVMSTMNKSTLYSVKDTLKRLGYKPFMTTTKKNYNIYVGPYKNMQKTNKAKKQLQHYFPKAYIIQQKQQNASMKKEVLQEQRTQTKNQFSQPTQRKKKYFVAFSIGYSSLPCTYSGNTAINTPSSSLYDYDLEIGYNQNKNFFYTLGYLIASNSDISINNINISANYAMHYFKSFPLYVGVLTGYSTLNWSTLPVSAVSAKTSSSALYIGAQVGFSYKLSDSYELFSSYQYKMLNHTTNITTNTTTAKLQQKTMNSLNFGIQYNF